MAEYQLLLAAAKDIEQGDTGGSDSDITEDDPVKSLVQPQSGALLPSTVAPTGNSTLTLPPFSAYGPPAKQGKLYISFQRILEKAGLDRSALMRNGIIPIQKGLFPLYAMKSFALFSLLITIAAKSS